MELHPSAGQNINSFVSQLLKASKAMDEEVTGVFNDRKIHVLEGDNEEKLVRRYYLLESLNLK